MALAKFSEIPRVFPMCWRYLNGAKHKEAGLVCVHECFCTYIMCHISKAVIKLPIFPFQILSKVYLCNS